MNHNTSLKLRRTIVLGIVVATCIAIPSAGAGNANGYQRALPCQPTCDQGTQPQRTFPQTPQGQELRNQIPFGNPGGVPRPAWLNPNLSPAQPGAASAISSPAVEVRGGFDWTDASIGAGFTVALLLLAGGLTIIALRHRRPNVPAA
jgi:hypothetical protein